MKLKWTNTERGVWKAQGTKRTFTITVTDTAHFTMDGGSPTGYFDDCEDEAQHEENMDCRPEEIRQGDVWGTRDIPTSYRFVEQVALAPKGEDWEVRYTKFKVASSITVSMTEFKMNVAGMDLIRRSGQ